MGLIYVNIFTIVVSLVSIAINLNTILTLRRISRAPVPKIPSYAARLARAIDDRDARKVMERGE